VIPALADKSTMTDGALAGQQTTEIAVLKARIGCKAMSM
jgi:hypothetical protein